MKIEDNGYSEEKTLLKEQKEIAVERTIGLCLNISEDWPLGRDCSRNSSLNSEHQLLHSDEKNRKVSFSYDASDRFLQSKKTVRNPIEQFLTMGQTKVTTTVIFFQRSSNSKSECEKLHIQRVEFGEDKSLSPQKPSDEELKLLNDGENACA